MIMSHKKHLHDHEIIKYDNIILNDHKLFEWNTMPQMIVNKNRVIIKVNRKFCELFGYDRSEILGYQTVVLTPSIEKFEEYRKYFIQNAEGIYKSTELEYKKKDGSLFWVKLEGNPINVDKNELMILWSFIDVDTEVNYRHHLEMQKVEMESMLEEISRKSEELSIANNRLKKLDQIKTDFLSTVSHELRTPLTSVMGFARIIQRRLEEVLFPLIPGEDRKVNRTVRQVRDNISIIISEGQRLTKLINDVLDIAKMEAGKIEWQYEQADMREIVDQSTAAVQSLLEQKKLHIQKKFPRELPEVVCDKHRIIQVIINLLSNAIKFTETGTIVCSIRDEQQFLKVSVQDQGVGIKEEDCQKLFEKFSQAGDTLTGKPQGTGLGLPICREIITNHDGKIWVESEPGQGSTFSFTLPLEKEPAAELAPACQTDQTGPALLPEEKEASRDKEAKPAAAKKKTVKAIDKNMTAGSINGNAPESRKKDHPADIIPADDIRGTSPDIITDTSRLILIADDEKECRTLLRQLLEERGFNIIEAKDGVETITLVRKFMPSLILLDVMMPGIGGLDVAVILKEDPATRDIPIVITTVLDKSELNIRAGVSGHFTKPVNEENILEIIRSLIKK